MLKLENYLFCSKVQWDFFFFLEKRLSNNLKKKKNFLTSVTQIKSEAASQEPLPSVEPWWAPQRCCLINRGRGEPRRALNPAALCSSVWFRCCRFQRSHRLWTCVDFSHGSDGRPSGCHGNTLRPRYGPEVGFRLDVWRTFTATSS